jgi:hypothetical protein
MKLRDRENLVREMFGDLAEAVKVQKYNRTNYVIVTLATTEPLCCAVSFSGLRRKEHFVDRVRNYVAHAREVLAA